MSRTERLAAAIDCLMTRRRVRDYSAMFLAVWVVGLVLTVSLGQPPRDAFGNPILPDYLNHWTGGRLVLDGAADRLYDVPTQQAIQDRTVGRGEAFAWFVAPPFAALYFAPFAALPYLPSALAWSAFSAGLLVLAARATRPLLPRLGSGSWRTALLVAAASQPVCELIGSGQDSAVSLLLWVVGVRLALARRDGLAGLVFALGLQKPQLFFLPPLLLLCWRRPRGLLVWALAAGALGGASLLLVGPEGLVGWLGVLASPLYRESVQAGQAWKMQSLPALFAAVVPAQFAPAAEAAGLLLGLVLIGGLVRQAVRHPPTDKRQEAALWGLGCLTTLLVSPHLPVYDLALFILPALLLVELAGRRRVRLALAAAFLLTWTIGLRHAAAAGWPWPLTALGASWTAVPLLLLWPILARLAGQAPSAVRFEAEPDLSPSGVPLRSPG